METRTARVILNKSGGNASAGAFNAKLSLPIVWVRNMGIDLDNREVKISYDGNKIIIERGE